MRVWWTVACVAVGGGLVGAATAPSQKEVLARAGALAARYGDELPRLVATETLDQALTPQPDKAGMSTSRQWVAEFAWVKLPNEADPIGFRDVIEVDGQAVGPGSRRLVELLHGSDQASWSQARAILQEGARHNLAPGSRNFNLPTVVLFFLLPERQARFSWKRRTEESAPVWELEFRERSRPTIIRRGDGGAIFSRGRVWVEAATGNVRRTHLALEFDRVDYTLTTRFERVPALDMVLPSQLDERYASPDEVVTGRATYANYRRFQTGARLVH